MQYDGQPLFFPGSVLVFAALLDYVLADPHWWLHPVEVMGAAIASLSQFFLAHGAQPWQRRWAGVVLGIILIGGSGTMAWVLVWLTEQVNPLLSVAVQVIGLASCLAGRSLAQAAQGVLGPLQRGDLVVARRQLSQFVGRDTEALSEAEILRATLESIAENSVDGVTAPLFYGILGAFLTGIGPLPLAIAYKAASTLDSMVGYRREPYTYLGWFSARLEDNLTWIPCRLTVLTLALWSGRPRKMWAICRRDAPHDPSPNSGWSECIYAAILGVQLGGNNLYQGIVKHKPLLGDANQSLIVDHINQALGLTRVCCLSWLAIAVIGLTLTSI